MSLKQNLGNNLIDAMKSKNETRLLVLRMVKSAIRNSEIQKQKELEDQDILQVLQSQIKSRRDSIDLYEKGGRPELAQKEKDEIAILSEFLPEQLTEDQIRIKVQEVIKETGASSQQDMGKVMGKIVNELKGKAEGGVISRIVKEELTK